jgi:hypothetical protein
MSIWEYSVEVIKLEYGQGKEWSVLASPHGEIKLTNRLNEFGKWEWELVSIMPALDEHGILRWAGRETEQHHPRRRRAGILLN